jgi:hypothetical protein
VQHLTKFFQISLRLKGITGEVDGMKDDSDFSTSAFSMCDIHGLMTVRSWLDV